MAMGLALLLALAAAAFIGGLWALGRQDDLLAVCLIALAAAAMNALRLALRTAQRGAP